MENTVAKRSVLKTLGGNVSRLTVVCNMLNEASGLPELDSTHVVFCSLIALLDDGGDDSAVLCSHLGAADGRPGARELAVSEFSETTMEMAPTIRYVGVHFSLLKWQIYGAEV